MKKVYMSCKKQQQEQNLGNTKENAKPIPFASMSQVPSTGRLRDCRLQHMTLEDPSTTITSPAQSSSSSGASSQAVCMSAVSVNFK